MNRLAMCLASGALLSFGCADGSSDGAESSSREQAPEVAKSADDNVDPPLHSYKLTLGPEHYVLYNVYSDGALLVGEKGERGDMPYAESHGLEGLSPVDAFSHLHPEAAVPAELAALQAFLDERGPVVGPDDDSGSIGSGRSSEPSLERGRDKATSDPASFKGPLFGCFFGQGDVYDLCITNWVQFTAFSAARSRWAIYKVAPYAGSLYFTVTVAGTPRLTTTIDQGGFWWQAASGPVRTHNEGTIFRPQNYRYPDVVDHRLDITGTNAYHFSARFHNYRVDQATCAEVWDRDRAQAGVTYGPCPNHYN